MAQDCDQTLAINGITIGETVTASPRWQITSFAELLKRDIRGDDRQIPYLAGRTAYPRRLDRTRMLLPMLIRGDYAAAGVLLADSVWAQQRITNLEALLAAWEPGVAGLNATTGLTTATWTRPDASTKTASVHVILPLSVTEPTKGPSTRYFHAVLDLNVPAGKFV